MADFDDEDVYAQLEHCQAQNAQLENQLGEVTKELERCKEQKKYDDLEKKTKHSTILHMQSAMDSKTLTIDIFTRAVAKDSNLGKLKRNNYQVRCEMDKIDTNPQFFMLNLI